MAIKRYIASADTTITNALRANLKTRGTGANMGASDILETFSIYGQASGSTGLSSELSRILIKFPVTDMLTDRTNSKIPASGSVKWVLKMYNAEHSQTLPKNFTLNVYALANSWEEGTGLDMEEYTDVTDDKAGANWINANRNYTAATATFVGTADLDDASGTSLVLVNADASTVTFTTDPTLNFGDVTADTGDVAATATFVGTTDLAGEDGTELILTNADGSTVTFHTDPTKGFGDTSSDDGDHRWIINTGGNFLGDGIRKATQAFHIACLAAIAAGELDMTAVPATDTGTQTSFTLTQTTTGTSGNTAITLITGMTANGETTFTGGMGQRWRVNTKDISGGSEVRKATQAFWIACKGAIDAGELDMTISPTTFAGTEESFTLTQATAGPAGNTAITLITGMTANGETAFTGGNDGKWSTVGGDFLVSGSGESDSKAYTTSFAKGHEDLDLDISELVEEWIDGGSISNYGVMVFLSGTQEAYFSGSGLTVEGGAFGTGAPTTAIDHSSYTASPAASGNVLYNITGSTKSYYTKKFFARGTEFFFKRPCIEARWDDTVSDQRGQFYFSSSLATGQENLNTLYLYNVVRGKLANIPKVGLASATATLTALSKTSGEVNTRRLLITDIEGNSVNFTIDNSTDTSTATVIGFSNANSDATQFATNIAAAINAADTAGTLNITATAATATVTLTMSTKGLDGNSVADISGTAISESVITATAQWSGGSSNVIYVTLFSGSDFGADSTKMSGGYLDDPPVKLIQSVPIETANICTGLDTATGSHVSTGIYKCDVCLTASGTEKALTVIHDVWHFSDLKNVQNETYFTGTIRPLHLSASQYDPTDTYVTTITNLRNSYFNEEKARFRMFVRPKNWNPNIYNKSTTAIQNTIINSGSYRVLRTIDEFDVIAYGTGSSGNNLRHTHLSYDSRGNYFDLDMTLLETGFAYTLKFAYYNDSISSWVEQPEVFKFRVES